MLLLKCAYKPKKEASRGSFIGEWWGGVASANAALIISYVCVKTATLALRTSYKPDFVPVLLSAVFSQPVHRRVNIQLLIVALNSFEKSS